MISELISQDGLRGLLDKATYAQLQLERKVTLQYRELLTHMFSDLIAVTPQWTGNLARNWQVQFTGVGQARYMDRSDWMQSKYGRTAAYKMGMDPAVSETLRRELPKFDRIQHNTKVTFVNRTPYAEEVSRGLGPLVADGRATRAKRAGKKKGQRYNIRQVNLGPAGDVLMLNYVKMKYNNLGVNIV